MSDQMDRDQILDKALERVAQKPRTTIIMFISDDEDPGSATANVVSSIGNQGVSYS
jgi:hypothetical protein